MATSESGAFEKALKRLEEIVAQLDGDEIDLDESVALFKEGKDLARRCESLLKGAQDAIERAALAPSEAAAQPAAARPRSSSGLFDETVEDDAVPF